MLTRRIQELKPWKKKPFYLGGGVFLLLILLCVIRIIIPCREYNYESIYNFDAAMEPGWTDIYEGIRLSPGVYRVELEYDTDTNQLWIMLLTVTLFVWLVFGISLTFYYYDREYPVSLEKKNVFFCGSYQSDCFCSIFVRL